MPELKIKRKAVTWRSFQNRNYELWINNQKARYLVNNSDHLHTFSVPAGTCKIQLKLFPLMHSNLLELELADESNIDLLAESNMMNNPFLFGTLAAGLVSLTNLFKINKNSPTFWISLILIAIVGSYLELSLTHSMKIGLSPAIN